MPKRTSGPKRKAEKHEADDIEALIKALKPPRSLKEIFDFYKWWFPSELLQRLENPPHTLSQEKTVYMVLHIKRNHRDDDKFKIEGIYSSLPLANELALDVFQENIDLNCDSCYDYYHCKSGRFDPALDHTIQWRVSDPGALALYISDIFRDTHKVYVQLHSVQSDLMGASNPADPNQREKMDNNDSDDCDSYERHEHHEHHEDDEDDEKDDIIPIFHM